MAKAKGKPDQTLRCLSVRQPFAWLLCANAKKVENRTWKTDFRGTIAIHASTNQSMIKSAERESESKLIKLKNFPFGAIIGLADIEAIEPYGPEFEQDGHACGPYCWKMTNGRLLKNPIPMMGKLTLYRLTPEIEARVLSSETYQVDLSEGSNESIIVGEFEPTADPAEVYFNYEDALETLVDKVDSSALMIMATRRVELEPELFGSYTWRRKLARELGEEEVLKADTQKCHAIFLEHFGCGEEDLALKVAHDEARTSVTGGNAASERETAEEPANKENNEEVETAEDEESESESDEDSEEDVDSIAAYEQFVEFARELIYDLNSVGNSAAGALIADRLVRLGPQNPHTHFDRGFVLGFGLKDYKASIVDLEKAKSLVEERIVAKNFDEESEEELREFQRLVSIQLARIYRRDDQLALAKSAIDEVLNSEPENPQANLNAGLIAEAMGDRTKAKIFAEATLQLGEYEVEARELLSRLDSVT